MKLETVYIISKYSPARYPIHLRQLDRLRKHGFKKFMICQTDYPEEALLDSPDIEYLNVYDFSQELDRPNIASARNYLLEKFYDSDEDFGLFLDDDISLREGKEYLDSEKFLELIQNAQSLSSVDCFTVATEGWEDFRAAWRNKKLFKENLVFQHNPNMAGHLICVRNLNKYYGIKHFFKESWCPTATGLCGEDVVFSLELARLGLGCYTLMNCVKQDDGDDNSTWLEGTRQENVEKFRKNLIRAYGLRTDSNGNIMWDDLVHPNLLTVKVPK